MALTQTARLSTLSASTTSVSALLVTSTPTSRTFAHTVRMNYPMVNVVEGARGRARVCVCVGPRLFVRVCYCVCMFVTVCVCVCV